MGAVNMGCRLIVPEDVVRVRDQVEVIWTQLSQFQQWLIRPVGVNELEPSSSMIRHDVEPEVR